MTEQQNGNNEVRRIVPQSGLDWNMMTTDTVWGSKQVSLQIAQKIKDRRMQTANRSESSEAWELLSMYTRDMRLANLGLMDGSLEYSEYYVDLSGDLLREGFSESFATAIARVATKLELSQSKGGFLRKRLNTLTTENLQGEVNEPKKKLISFGKTRG